MQFSYSVDQCDIGREKRADLEKFRERLAMWHSWLSEDEHSIWGQITSMLWNDTVFWTINEARRIAEQRRPSPNVGFNWPVANFIDQSYTATQLLAIRRLTDRSREKRRDFISLPRLLDDMRANADLFTRELYVCHDGLPFSPRSAQERRRGAKPRPVALNGRVESENVGGPDDHDTADLLHDTFTRLAGAQGASRSRDDGIDKAIFDQASRRLKICDRINRVASKFIAHAADAASRGQLNEMERRITFARIAVCQRVICRVAHYVTSRLLFITDRSLAPIPPYGHLKDLDKAWVDANNLIALYWYWDRHSEAINNWTKGDWPQRLGLPWSLSGSDHDADDEDDPARQGV